ncbi:hypothetical protein TNCV_1489841 [Trichonephila clavipes]|nr:hypothetical protein TNCV_1489841 [Trichonephila clavipes]
MVYGHLGQICVQHILLNSQVDLHLTLLKVAFYSAISPSVINQWQAGLSHNFRSFSRQPRMPPKHLDHASLPHPLHQSRNSLS